MGIRATAAGLETQLLDKIRKNSDDTNQRLDAVLAELKAIRWYLAQAHEREDAPTV
jgi:hypothetical protein